VFHNFSVDSETPIYAPYRGLAVKYTRPGASGKRIGRSPVEASGD
jgi:hypothetical protein